MKRRVAQSATTLCLAIALLQASAPRADLPAKQLTAEAILDRYVQVTGGLDLYRRFGSFAIYSTVTRADGTTFNTALYHSRDGTTRTEIDADADSSENGVSSGIVWEYSQKKGARILSGKVAERRTAEELGLDADDWRKRFPAVKTAGVETVNGRNCYLLKLTRTDRSVVERFYDTQSGLLVREISTGFDPAGEEQPVTTDIEEYSRWMGINHPALMRVKAGSTSSTIRIDSMTYFPSVSSAASEIPREVVRAAVAQRDTGAGALPNPVDLIERFVEVTGGKNAYASINTQAAKAEIAFPTQNLRFPVVIYAAKGKLYGSMDVPSMGKFEFGNDGVTSWERSVVLGPRLEPHSAVGGLLGPTAGDILRWSDAGLSLQTLGKEDVNGAPCYNVKMGPDLAGQPSGTACFDVRTGLLVKESSVEFQGTNIVRVETRFSDYQSTGNFKTPHPLEPQVGGEEAVIDLKEIAINESLPEGVFDLPPDVRALKEKKMADLDADRNSERLPTLKREN